MKRWGAAVALLVLVLAGVASAQDTARDVAVDDQYILTLPEGWDIEEGEDGDFTISHGETRIWLMPPAVFDAFVIIQEDTAVERLMDACIYAHGKLLMRSEIDVRDVDGVEIAATDYTEDDGTQGISLVMEIEAGVFVFFDLRTPPDTPAETIDDASTIILSFRSSAGLQEPCMVQAARDRVDLRVGPGANRGVYAAMPSGEAIPVLGKATVSDGSLWWRLDMPTGAASELWVADRDVTTQGGCALVRDVNAPPVVPGGPAPADSGAPAAPDAEPAPVQPAPAGLVQCPLVNLSVFTIKGNMSGPGGPYYFEVPAGGRVVMTVEPGNYNVHWFCDGCGGAGTTSVFPCDGWTEIHLQVTDRP